jgi:hypothetical protein
MWRHVVLIARLWIVTTPFAFDTAALRGPCRTRRDDDKPATNNVAGATKSPVLIEEISMKLVLTLLGVVLLVIAAVYFLIPADQLPSFFPGYEAGVSRVHAKHGIVSGVAGLVLIAAGVWMGRR